MGTNRSILGVTIIAHLSYYQHRQNFGVKFQQIEAVIMGRYGGGWYFKYEDLFFYR